jgi:asparagine synthetase B (glutamine-hydrolysing)
VYFSGSGADEIYSDYGFQGKKIFSHSNFGGLFGDNLQSYFPWASFFGSTMRAYLMKEELVAGAFGIEGRYPFLDVALTQEWLAIKVNLKNSKYKAPLAELLDKLAFPYTSGEKLGF